MKKIYIGIDVGSKDLVLAYYDNSDNSQLRNYNNTKGSIIKLVNFVKSLGLVHVIVEATGTYSKRLVYALNQADIEVSLISPKQAKSFGIVMKKGNKTDPEDARSLAKYGLFMKPPLYKSPSEKQEKTRQIIKYISYLQKEKTRISNKLHALSFEQFPCEYVVIELEQALQEKEIAIEQAMQKLEMLKGEDLKEAIEKAESVVGIGHKTALFLILLTGGFQNFESAKQVANFIGIYPVLSQSGSSNKPTRISKKGNKHLRSLLYMCARSAKRYNPVCKALYDRLRQRGKPHKVAMVAVAHKLLHQVFAVVTKNEVFDRNFQTKKTQKAA